MLSDRPEINFFGFERRTCTAFTGYRPCKFTVSFPRGGAHTSVVDMLRPVIRELYEGGMRYFLSGMADGFDLWAASEVLALRDSGDCPDVKVVAVVPYRGQARGYGVDAKLLYDYVMREACRVEVLAERYYPECFHHRNAFMVNNASCVVCYYDGQSGGTRHTVRLAHRNGLRIINLCETQLDLF